MRAARPGPSAGSRSAPPPPPPRARFLREASCATHAAHVLDDALLLVSEAVANAVRHGAPPVVVAVDCDESRGLRVRVRDGSPTPPVQREAELLDEGGRGVQLIDLLSTEWGVEDAPEGGKAVWFLLPASSTA